MKELIVNFSGGKDSTAMLHLMLEHGEKIDEVIYFDGGWEFPQMEEHVNLVEEKTGIKITRLKPIDGDFDYWMLQREFTSRKKESMCGKGIPSSKSRWCTFIKQQTILKYLKGRDTIRCIGFAVGEEKRLLRGWNKDRVFTPGQFRFPLIEDYNFDEKECLQYCYKLGYTWGGLYNYIDRVSCYFCPLMNNAEALMIKRHFPETWEAIKNKCSNVTNALGIERGGCAYNWKNGVEFDVTDRKLRGKEEGWNLEEWYDRLNIPRNE